MSDIVFQEVSQIDLRLEVTRRFPFLFNDGSRMAVAKPSDGTGIILELSKVISVDENFHLSIDEVRPPNVLSVVDKNDAPLLMAIYTKSPILERQILLLDPVFALVLSTEVQPASIVHISLPPVNLRWKFEMPAAVVTNGGVCEIRARRNNLRVYDHTFINISQIWQEVCIQYRPAQFEDINSLTKYYSDLVFTTTCWSDQGADTLDWILYCATRSGLIVIFTICDWVATVRSITKTALNNIMLLKFFSFNYQGTKLCMLFAANTNGQLKLFSQKESSLNETATLWSAHDNMTIHSIEVNYYENIEKIIVVTSKGTHLLAFLLSPDGELLGKFKEYVGNIAITGIQYMKDYQYIICSLNGKTHALNLQIDGNEIVTSYDEIQNIIDAKTYEVLGMVASKNKVAWLFLQFPIQLFEHKFRNPTMITICSISTMDPLHTFRTKSDTKIYELDDCAEIIRCSYLRYGMPDCYPEFDWNESQITSQLIRKLKIWAVVLMMRMCYHRKKLRNDDALTTQRELLQIRNLLDTSLAYKRLNRLAHLSDLTSVQKISGVYFRKKMLDFCQGISPKWMQQIREGFVPSIYQLLLQTEEFNQAECEKCVYCDDYVNLETGTCKDNHKVARCCITFLQIPLFSARSCSTCHYAAIDDDSLLKQILCDNETVVCPLCDSPLMGPKTDIYLRQQ